jgi:8-amino-7-oxononanoate synthase
MNPHFLSELLERRVREETYRELPDLHGKIDFCSNDYLGLSGYEFDLDNLKPLKNGATGSRLISGNHPIALQTENYIAGFHGAEAGLIYNCGYMANLGLITSVVSRNDIIIHDELVHASILDGIRLCGAVRMKFDHNNTASLHENLSKANEIRNTDSRIFVVVESVYSMDGDIAPLSQISEYCKAANAFLIVDEAHAVGVKGDMGRGVVSDMGLESSVFARVVTFGKAIGLHGAIVLGSTALIQVLINYSRAFIYTTALAPSAYQLIQAHYKLLSNERISGLQHRIKYFQNEANKYNQLNWKLNDSPIQLLFMNGSSDIRSLADYLQKNNFAVKAILSPTVKKGYERIRFSIHSFNTEAQIADLFKKIGEHNFLPAPRLSHFKT